MSTSFSLASTATMTIWCVVCFYLLIESRNVCINLFRDMLTCRKINFWYQNSQYNSWSQAVLMDNNIRDVEAKGGVGSQIYTTLCVNLLTVRLVAGIMIIWWAAIKQRGPYSKLVCYMLWMSLLFVSWNQFCGK